MQKYSSVVFYITQKYPLLVIILLMLASSSCRITKNVPDNQYLLDKAKIEIVAEDKDAAIKAGELDRYIRQKPNKRVLFFRFHLQVYNLAREGKEKGFNRLFRTVGQEPVLLDTFLTDQTATNLKRFLDSKGFYNSKVEREINRKKKRADVKYTVYPGDPYRIRDIKYVIEDTLIRNIVLADSSNRLVQSRALFDMDLLRQERQRIENVLREDGYFFFSRDFITFNADTIPDIKVADLDLVIRNRFTRNEFGERIPQTYRKYEVNNVYVYTNYDPVELFYLEEANFLDTVLYDNQKFIYALSPGIKFQTISNANLIRPGQIYSESIVQKTRSNLNSLRLYRVVNVYFRPDEEAEKARENDNSFLFFNGDESRKDAILGKLNCYIQLTPHTLQSYLVDFVGTNASSDIGVEGNFNYQHKNIFNGAEVLDTRLRGMVQFFSTETALKNSLEVGGSIGLNFPRFLSPFSGEEFIHRYSPRTQMSVSYSYQDRPDYTRTLAGSTFGYTWRGENRYAHTFTPVEVNVINIFSIDPLFYQRIQNTYLVNSYKNQLITLSSYNFLFTNQTPSRNNFSLLRFNVELSGNILNTAYHFLGEKSDDGTYQLFSTSFSQFVLSDINYVFNHRVDKNTSFVYRVYAGAALPYGNSKALPFEKKFFSGGSTGVRAWNARALGPGTYVEDKSLGFLVPNQTADIKFEANIEYRFKLFWMLEGALFADAGNIWAITRADDRPGAVFNISEFYKQIALGTGAGIRMNLGFFTLRFDLGIKVYNPGVITDADGNVDSSVTNYHWIPFDRRYSFDDDFVIHFGIGYPF